MNGLLTKLLKNKLLKQGEKLFFEYNFEKNTYRFYSIVNQNGLLIENGKVFNPTGAATYYIIKLGDNIAVNGWLLWKNEEGLTLSDLYFKLKNIPPRYSSHELPHYSFINFRKTSELVFIMGAGSVLGKKENHGVFIQSHILPTIFNLQYKNPQISSSYNELIEFIKSFFHVNNEMNMFPSLESIFILLDFLIENNESLSDGLNVYKLIKIKECLIGIIHYVVELQTNKSDIEVLSNFWETINTLKLDSAIISINYDTTLAKSFECLYPFNCYIDYCNDLINYDYHQVTPQELWVNPRGQLISYNKLNPKVFKLIKLHGDLDWLYCNCCHQLKINILPNIEEKIFTTSYNLKCSFDGNYMQHLLRPPSLNTKLEHPILISLRREALRELQYCKKVIFIGYSLPEADVDIKTLLIQSKISNKECIVINPDTSLKFKNKFLNLNPNTKFIHKTFEELLKNKKYFKSILEN